MFADTITMSIDGSDRALTRVNQDKFSSNYRYRSANIQADLNIRHTDRVTPGKSVKTERHNVELIVTTFVDGDVGPVPTVRKTYVVIEAEANQAATSVDDLFLAMGSFLTVANIAKLVNWES